MIIIISPLCLLHQDLEKTYIFVSLLHSLQHDYDKKTLFWFYRCVDYAAIIRFFFIYFDTTFTTPCSRWKTFFISVFCSLRHGDRKNKFNLYYITALTTVDHEKKHSFIWSYFYVLPWSKKKKLFFIYPLQSLCIHLLTSLTSTSGVLDDLLPVLVVLTPALNESF